MTTVRDLVTEVRSLLQGSLPDEMSVLDSAYTPGDTHLILRYPKKSLGTGSLISVGLGTFYTLGVSADGRTVEVLPRADGGPDAAISGGEVVLLRPRYTTWAIFNSWNGELLSMSAPINGLYAFNAFVTVPNWVNGTYPVPTDWTAEPTNLLIARYRMTARDSWQRIDAEFQPDQRAVRIYGTQPQASYLEFIFAFPFLEATSLDQPQEELGLNEHTNDIPGLGAAANLARSVEGRRNQLMSQGDARNAAEVPAGANLGVSRDWRSVQQQRITEEAGRLLAQFGYWAPPDRTSRVLGR